MGRSGHFLGWYTCVVFVLGFFPSTFGFLGSPHSLPRALCPGLRGIFNLWDNFFLFCTFSAAWQHLPPDFLAFFGVLLGPCSPGSQFCASCWEASEIFLALALYSDGVTRLVCWDLVWLVAIFFFSLLVGGCRRPWISLGFSDSSRQSSLLGLDL